MLKHQEAFLGLETFQFVNIRVAQEDCILKFFKLEEFKCQNCIDFIIQISLKHSEKAKFVESVQELTFQKVSFFKQIRKICNLG